MGIFLFIVFSAMEIALAIFGRTKLKKFRRLGRTILCAAEFLAAALVIILPGTEMKWRFTGCLIIFAVRFAVHSIIFIAKRKKKDEQRSTARTVIGCIMSILCLFFSLLPAFVFTGYQGLETTGSYSVNEIKAILIDKSRLETYENDGSNREIPIHFYYPDGDAENCPFVLFAHGSFGYYQSNSSLYTELASNGYVVASIDHPYYAFFTTDTDGNTITVDIDFMKTCIDIQNSEDDDLTDYNFTKEWMNVRVADENFVLDSIKSAKNSGTIDNSWFIKSDDVKSELLHVLKITDTEKIGLTGHSIGGAAAVELGRKRNDITAVIDIDGTMINERNSFENGEYTYEEEPYPIPLLSLDNESHWSSYANSPTGELPYVNKYVLDNAVDGRELHFDGTGHMNFTDLPLLSPFLSDMLGTGDVDPEEFTYKMNSIILEYFNFYLKGEGELSIASWDSDIR